jgi:hypothetical protein
VYAAKISKRSEHGGIDQRKEGWLLRVIGSRWVQSPWVLPPLLIFFNCDRLVIDLKSTGPVTRLVVFDIARDVSRILWGFFLIFTGLIVGEEIRRREKIQRALLVSMEAIQVLTDTQREFSSGVMEILQSTVEVAAGPVESYEIFSRLCQQLMKTLRRLSRKAFAPRSRMFSEADSLLDLRIESGWLQNE